MTGGDPNAVVHLISYFFGSDAPVPVSDILWRKSGTSEYRRETFKTERTPSSYVKKPVYILMGPDSFSAAEHFAYDVQALKCAVIVGQVSKGGANPGGPRPVGAGLWLAVPTGRSDNPITHTNWEGKGVQPDVATASDENFATAYALALKATGGKGPAAATPDVVTEARLLPPARTTAAPGAEAALKSFIPAMAAGNPPSDILGGAMGWLAERQLAMYQKDLKRLGTLEGLSFVKVDDVGLDVFEARFANGTLVFTLAMDADGKIAACQYQPK